MRQAEAANRENQAAFKCLQGEKDVVEAEFQSIKGAYSRLKDQVQSIALELSSIEKALELSYNQVIPLREEFFAAMDSQSSLRAELAAAKEENKISQAKLEALSNSPKEFEEFFWGSTALIETTGDMIFIAMSNLYFFNLSKGKQVDFSAAFHPVPVPDFTDVFPGRASAAKRGEYLDEEPMLDF